MKAPSLYGLAAEFATAESLTQAAGAAKKAGYSKLDAYSPFPIHGLSEALEQPFTRLPWFTFLGGLAGLVGAFALQYWTSVIDYPLNVGGRPLMSWPAWIPVMFECAVLLGGIATVVGIIITNGLPLLHHPAFEIPGFDRVTDDRFFLCIESADPLFDVDATRRFLQEQKADAISEVQY